MRIIGGTARSRRLRAPAGAATRPTADRVREALFNILGPPPEDLAVLDLFAGAGGLGLEALSRGAARAVFVDRAPAAVRCLEENVASLGMGDRAEILAVDVARALRTLDGAFGWVFIDPPYKTDLALATVAALSQTGALLTQDAIVVAEHDRRRPLPDANGILTKTDQRIYGDTALSFYGRVAP